MRSPVVLLLCAVVVLVLMSAGAIAILQVQGRRDRLSARIGVVTAPFQRRSVAVTAPASGGVGLAADAAGIGHLLARLFGFDPALQDHYVLRWWLALVVWLAAAAAAGRIASGLLGPLALLVVPPAWVVFSRSFFQWCERRRRDKLFVQFPRCAGDDRALGARRAAGDRCHPRLRAGNWRRRPARNSFVCPTNWRSVWCWRTG